MAEEKPQNHPPAGGPNFNELEKGILKFWDEDKTFEKSLEKTRPKDPSAAPQDERPKPFIFYDGPPFATGLPHYGSILPSVIKDAIPRYQTMKGRYVRRRWGWDCHGLPIENIVEQNLKISGKKQIEEIGVERFNHVCRENVLKYAEEWGKTIHRIARWVDFNGSYKTMDNSYMESVWWGLKSIWEKELIYEDRKVLLYCSRCETSISNFEVAMDNSYRDVTEESVYAKFKLPKGQRIVNDLTNDKTYALAWTTTPWTLPGNTSLNIGPDIVYVMIEMENKDRYILAKERLSIIISESYEIIAEFPARALEGLSYEPLYPGVIIDSTQKAHKIYLADFVTTSDGTGIVHNAAMYGEEDYKLAKEKGLPRQDMLDHQGRYLPAAPENLRGVFFKDANEIILKELEEKGLSYKVESYAHSYPHCYRCGTPLFYSALPAWFINIQKIKPELLKNNETINWYPEHLKHGRFKQGVENAPDWNISRNRYWATALPFWKCENKECKNVACVGSVAELKEKATNFSEVYPNFQGDLSNLEQIDLHKPYVDNIKLKCEKCASVMSRIPEVVDCWVESGSMPFAELHAPFEHAAEPRGSKTAAADLNADNDSESFENRFPADFVVEYIPQTRAWFYVMHVVSSILFEQAPFKNVVTTGTILAEDGSKMSKSKNNYPDPGLVIEKYGADALRFYLLTSPVVTGEDLHFSEKGVSEVSRKVNMLLYNVWSFYRMYEVGRSENRRIGESESHVLDKWIVSLLSKIHKEVTKYLDNYDTVRAGKVLTHFIDELSTWYLRRSRERIKNGGEAAKQALDTLSFVLVELSKMLAPFMPFLAEFIYRDLTRLGQTPASEEKGNSSANFETSAEQKYGASAGAVGQESVHLASWSQEIAGDDEAVRKNMDFVKELAEAGLSQRKELNLKVRQPLAEVEYHIKIKEYVLSEEFEKLLADELNVKLVSNRQDFVAKNGWVLKETPNFKLALNITLNDELKAEGTARELERQVQDLRKKSGLKVGELVDLYYNTPDAGMEQALLKLLDRKKTFVSQISRSLEIEVDFEIQTSVDGKTIWLGMIKI